MVNESIVLKSTAFSDDRGTFLETWSDNWDLGNDVKLKQSNIVWTKDKLTLRGFHAQRPPRDMTKVVRVLQGEILDIYVDARKGNKGYGDWKVIHLDNPDTAVVVPNGWYHGYITLTDDTIVQYHQTDTWSKEHEVGINWRSARYLIDTYIDIKQLIVNERDDNFPDWADGFKF